MRLQNRRYCYYLTSINLGRKRERKGQRRKGREGKKRKENIYAWKNIGKAYFKMVTVMLSLGDLSFSVLNTVYTMDINYLHGEKN